MYENDNDLGILPALVSALPAVAGGALSLLSGKKDVKEAKKEAKRAAVSEDIQKEAYKQALQETQSEIQRIEQQEREASKKVYQGIALFAGLLILVLARNRR